MFERTAGALLSVTSLPGPFGIGVLGREAKEWVDQLAQMEFRWWQVLPFNPLTIGNSPYTSLSAFAGNPLLIDPRLLREQGLADEGDVEEQFYQGVPYSADYGFATEKRIALLQKAYARQSDAQREAVQDFVNQNPWLESYSLYMAAKEKAGGAPWWEWDAPYRTYEACLNRRQELAEAISFWCFTQYIFWTQWAEIKAYANKKGIGIIGDMPIYVSLDSVDVWSHPHLFHLDDTLRPTKVAGVPPDYFSAEGQLWGNPLYDWDAMKADGYQWWTQRIGQALDTFDTVRIDHFRGFADYYAVPANAKSAKEGHWEKGPGAALFEAIRQKYPEPAIIAEDLGITDDAVAKLLEETGFPGMRVIQFGFDPDGDSTHLPHNYPANCLAYTGTHDNNTLLGWLWEAAPKERAFALDYCGFNGQNWGDGGFRSESCRCLIQAVWRSSASIAILPLQDLCGFGSDARMNRPGVADGNWLFRITKEALAQLDMLYFRDLNRLYRRTYPYKKAPK